MILDAHRVGRIRHPALGDENENQPIGRKQGCAVGIGMLMAIERQVRAGIVLEIEARVRAIARKCASNPAWVGLL